MSGKNQQQSLKKKGQSDQIAPIPLEKLPDDAREFIEALPREKQPRAVKLFYQQTMIKASAHSGPLPHPESYARYDEVLPGSADRILGMAERQSAHRMELEKIALRRQFNQSGAGQWIAAVIALFLISAGSYLIYSNHDTAGSSIIVATVVGIIYTFVKGKDAQKKDLEEK